ncbi:MAG: chalcone isomerase family protein [Rhodospirillales bacterium]|nr:chalcone isomerase family protein [Rhodospirillales bacterium]
MMSLNLRFLGTSFLALSILATPRAQAAQLAGVTMPDAQTLGAQTLTLNGIGLRTYSFMRVHIYVAGLYLPQPMNDASSILKSPEPKILSLHFLHNVGLTQERSSWKKGLIANCMAPCNLSSAELQEFLATLKPISAGEEIQFIFAHQGMNAYENGQLVGHVGNPQLAQLVLAVFIGPHVSAVNLKKELLGGH